MQPGCSRQAESSQTPGLWAELVLPAEVVEVRMQAAVDRVAGDPSAEKVRRRRPAPEELAPSRQGGW
jgi:hypothetical protein